LTPYSLKPNGYEPTIEEEQKRLIEAIGSFEATGGEPKIVIEFLDTASLSYLHRHALFCTKKNIPLLSCNFILLRSLQITKNGDLNRPNL
jgi:hypothetical protein